MNPSEAPLIPAGDADKAAACAYLSSLLNKHLRVHTTDARMFRGEFKCTDPVAHTNKDRNVVLAHTYEYRQPSDQQKRSAAAAAGAGAGENAAAEKVTLDLTSRYLGLVVVPGQYIVKMELEEFASQVRGQGIVC